MSVPFPSAHGGGGGGVGEEVGEDEEDEGTSTTAGEQRKNGHEKLKLKTEAGAEDAGESIHRPLESLQRAIDQLNTYQETYLRLKH